jgi:tRNA (mo5U34)-methyltransferase
MLDAPRKPITQAEVDAFKWFHSIDFGNGVVAKGKTKSLKVIADESDVIFKHGVAGKSVMDIGAWDGAYTFESLRRGAKDILAVDSFIWAGHLKGYGKRTFDFANEALGADIPSRLGDIHHMTPRDFGIHDVVLFMGVLYHLKHPLYALERLADLTRDYAVIETATSRTHNPDSVPLMQFIPDASLGGDSTNWCLPNTACVEAWLRSAGFKRVDTTPHPAHPLDRHFFHAWK